MRRLALCVGLLYAVPAAAQWASVTPDHPYRGQWGVTKPNNPRYQASILIDSDGRVTIDSPDDNGRVAKLVGYVKFADDKRVHIVVTGQNEVANSHCTVHSSELLHCYTIRQDKSVSTGATMVKVGPGPHRLTRPGQ